MPGPLILIDGFSLVFRAYHALSRTGMQSPAGEPTFAVFAFANILTSLLDKHKPDAIAVVFDTKEPTFRHVMYPEYKAHRDAFPDDLVPQIGRIKELIRLMGLEQVEMPGFEADDIIGTIAARESQDGHEILCVTSDKDYFQLVTDKVKILRPGKDVGEYEVYDAVKVKEKFGVGPEHVIDALALIGDTSDNVPGVKGVGEKTALPLVVQYGSVEGIYEHLDEIDKASLKKKLEENRDNAFLSKTLVTIHTDVPVDAKRVALVRRPMDFQAIDAFCADMGFHTLRKKFAKYAEANGVELDLPAPSLLASSNPASEISETSAPSGNLSTLDDVAHNYTLVDTEGGLQDLLKALAGRTLVSVDLETTGLDAMMCAIVGVAICVDEGTAWYIDVNDPSDRTETPMFGDHSEQHGLPVQMVIDALRPMLQDPHVGKLGQNLKYDALVLRRHDVVLSPIEMDTMLASYVLDPDKQHNLDALAERWLHYRPISITSLIGEKKSEQRSMRDVDPSVVTAYAGEDADVAFKLGALMRPELEREGLWDLARNLEFPVEEVLVTMEFNGICVDTSALANLSEFTRSEAARLEKEIWHEAGEQFTISSPKQLGEVLFERMMLPAGKKTKTGFSTDSSVLTELALTFPIAQMVLDYRQVEKLRSTYVEALPKMINPRTGRLHTTFNQTVAATGRLSSTSPNLQNIPVRTELGQQIRKAFVPQRKDHVIVSADYSQIELRIMASICKDPNLINAFASGEDVHKATAATLFDTPLAEVTSDQRRIAKTVNFGIMYGQGAFGLAQTLGLSRTESQQIIANYFEKYPGIKKYIDDTIATTRDRGYATTLLGRRRYFPLINGNNRGLQAAAERAAINSPIQGTAADMMKVAMINVHRRMQEERVQSIMMLQVHDELLFEVPTNELDVMIDLARTEMVNAFPLEGVPIVVDVGHGASWYEAH
ncbi:MAG: DNA polymerase I [Ignavibacteriae bacterium]|nr:MAG: DNA polymerase I [Ignavibacteriota bacterium]